MSKRRRQRSSEALQRRPAFFIYPSHDEAQVRIIEKAVDAANADPKCGLTIRTWRRMQRKTGRIITNILTEIDNAQCVLADITGLNLNVLFEVGYAFGKRKHILLFTQGNSREQREADLRDLEMLANLEITSFQNSAQLCAQIVERNPFLNPSPQPEIAAYRVAITQPPSPQVGLFLKGSTNHEYALACYSAFKECFPTVVLDDWTEDQQQPLSWYISSVVEAAGVLAVFVNPTWDNGRRVNARYSFVSGLAHALGRRLLMVGLPGYQPPFDQREFLKLLTSEQNAQKLVVDTFKEISAGLSVDRRTARAEHRPAVERAEIRHGKRHDLILLDIALENVANTIAENEERELSEYFVETSQFKQALLARQALFIGAKGSGKTANFFQLARALGDDRRNLVCEIKPSDYKLTRFLEGLKKIGDPEGRATHAAETAWKFVVYTELLSSAYKRIMDRPPGVGISLVEQSLISFVEDRKDIVLVPFEAKLERATEWLSIARYDPDSFSSEIHNRFISPARKVMRPYFQTLNRVVVLVDNLDKAWDVEQDLSLQARAIFALLGTEKRIATDFDGKIDVRLTVFLRRNIFEHLVRLSRERDKLIATAVELIWDDPELLFRILERRIQVACERHGVNYENPWESLFPAMVQGSPVREWIRMNVLPRPRDLIHFVRKAMELAINRNHTVVDEQDMLDAVRSYSGFATQQAIAEYHAEYPWVSDIVPSFAGQPDRWTLRQLTRFLGDMARSNEFGVPVRDMIVALVELGMLGVEFNGKVKYATTMQDSLLLAEKVRGHPIANSLWLVIHPAMQSYLLVQQRATNPSIDATRKATRRFRTVGEYLGLLLRKTVR